MEPKSIKVYALEQLREYLIINDIELNSNDDFISTYFKMHKEGYFYKAEVSGKLDEIKKLFSQLSRVHEVNRDIIERDLIFRGPLTVLEKMTNKAKKISVK